MTLLPTPVGARHARETLFIPKPARASIGLLTLSLLLSGCMLGPDYQRPALEAPAQFKQIEGWTLAKPGDELARGQWWQLYNDAELNALAACRTFLWFSAMIAACPQRDPA